MLKSHCVPQEEPRTGKALAEKNDGSTIAMFAAGLAHELGNPLDAIRRYVNLALEQAAADPAATQEHLLKAKKGIAQTLFLLNEIATYSRQCYDYPARIVEVHSLLEQSLDGLGEEERFQGISIHKMFCEETMFIEDRGLLIVLYNLYKNAAQAMKGSGTLTVATFRQNGSACVVVQDSGQGVPERIKERIFDPFFSTKNGDGGTGIGLALSREIVERSGGELRCETVLPPDSGARFLLILPRKTPDHVFANTNP
jgi:signal transduction histidine kinase